VDVLPLFHVFFLLLLALLVVFLALASANLLILIRQHLSQIAAKKLVDIPGENSAIHTGRKKGLLALNIGKAFLRARHMESFDLLVILRLNVVEDNRAVGE
jgi:hypothetical protein